MFSIYIGWFLVIKLNLIKIFCQPPQVEKIMSTHKHKVYIKLTVDADSIDDAIEIADAAMESSVIREQQGILNAELVDDIDFEYDEYEVDEDGFEF